MLIVQDRQECPDCKGTGLRQIDYENRPPLVVPCEGCKKGFVYKDVPLAEALEQLKNDLQ